MAKQELQKLIESLKQKKQQDEQKKWQEEQAKGVMTELQKEQTKSLQPVLEGMAKVMTDKMTEEFSKAVSSIKVDTPQVNVPEMKMPEIVMPDYPTFNVPEPKVTVNFDASRIKVPNVIMPSKMEVMGDVGIKGVDYKNPLPVQIWDGDGKPLNLLDGLAIRMGGSGGKIDYLTVKGFGQSAFAELTNPDGRLKVELPTGSSGLTDTELRASSVPVEQVSGSIWSTYVTGSSGSLAASIVDSSGVQYSGSNPLPVVITSGASATSATNIVDSSGVAYSGSNPVPVVFSSSGTTAVYNLNAEGLYRDTFPVQGTVAVSGVTNSIGATILNGEGLARDSWLVSGITNTVATANVDSGGVQYSGSNPFPFRLVTDATATLNVVNVDSTGAYRGQFPVTLLAGSAAVGSVTVNGSTNSLLAVGPIVSDAADVGSAPIKIGGIARTANPTAVAAGDMVSATMDDLGRQLTRPVQVRDLISTAYVSKTTGSTFGTETTLFAGATNTYHDLIYILASNDSTVAIGVDVRGTLAGNILMHLEIPANSTTGLSLPVPLPAGDVGASWTIDLPDVTGTNVYVSALFSKEV